MTQEDKELLIRYLCMALPYGVICYNSNTEANFKLEDTADISSGYPTFDYGYGDIESVKPYLRPMSSMTEEDKEAYHHLCYEEEREEHEFGEWVTRVFYHDTVESIDWLNAHHLDYRGLIEKGLAIEVTESNNPYV